MLKTEQRAPARSPALPVAAAFIAGVLFDDWAGPAFLFWLAFAFVAWAAWLVVFRRGRDRAAPVLLLLCCAAAGGARHHLFLSVRGDDDVSLFATEDGTPVRLIGTLVDQPAVRGKSSDPLASAWPRADQSTCTLRCDAIIAGDKTVPVSGQARLTIEGHLLHATLGDRVEVRGWLFPLRGPRNPGEFDYRQYLRRQGTDCVVFAGHPDAVRRLRSGEHHSAARAVAAARERTQELMVAHLSDRTRPVATALLVGDRSELTDETQTAFVESGMMHVMAISGVNVAILAGFVLTLCRGLNVSQTATCLVVMLIVLGYALFAEARPPILRATVFIVAAFAGRPWHRQASMVNGLALAALVVLVWRPTDLFDIGAQLSFLAVAGIAWGEEWDRRWSASRSGDVPMERGAFHQWWRGAGARIREGQFMMAAIWLLTAPLIAAEFHLVSPVGLALNIVLAPLVFAVLWLGYAFLLCGWILPPLAGLFGRGFDVLLGLMLESIDAAAAWNLGHAHCPAPPAWWLAAYYLLMVTAFGLRHRRGHGRWLIAAGLAWTALGLGLGLRQEPAGRLRCTFLDVGHGCAVLVETPQNRTLLCDAGSLTNGRRAVRAAQNALWERGHSRIDALVVT
ncbi:MAG: ComEC/Rec2 family competence protein, partial [Planctomycetaceae bacterium]